MSGRGKGGKVKAKSKRGKGGRPKAKSKRGKGGKAKATSKRCSFRAGLQFPVGRLYTTLRLGKYADDIGSGAPVRMAAVLEYLTAIIFESAGNAAVGERHITCSHLDYAIQNNAELDKLYSDIATAKKVSGLKADVGGRPKVAKKGGKRVGEKKGGNIAGTAEKKRKTKRAESFVPYIYSVLKLVHPDANIGSRAMSFMNYFIDGVFGLIASEASRNCSTNKSRILSERDVQVAVNLVVTGDLATFLETEGTKAVVKYCSSKL